ncbi:hypothetical protein Clacol_010502 [Clathrus columnatus]|uniref:RMT2 domain-containing protein n=1 Tax=Clathrus columnatus TaxID=1419009 RepID=A0AAV5AV61_9AGAM|nr:hypothetical protein Clacol_010502 [Clathrus columnatus]
MNSDDATELGSQLIETIFQDPSNIPQIQTLIKEGAPLWYQTDDEGVSALHAACYVESIDLIKLLLENGAPWNLIDSFGNTAADIALSFNDEENYRLIRDAGVRTEFLLHALSSQSETLDVLKNEDPSPFGSSSAFLESNLIFSVDKNGQEICSVISDGETVGVMMGWERNIMQRTVDLLCSNHPSHTTGLRILNIGFGLGIIDDMFQNLNPPPIQHTIIEAHKDVLTQMRNKGWYDKPGVKILEGRWQDLTDAALYGYDGGWDVVYIDTFAEGYEGKANKGETNWSQTLNSLTELKNYFDILPNLLNGPEARFSFFNGLGATNSTIYDVYTQIAELHLQEAGLSVQWSDVDLDAELGSDKDRWGDTRKYFNQRFYRLPIATMDQI